MIMRDAPVAMGVAHDDGALPINHRTAAVHYMTVCTCRDAGRQCGSIRAGRGECRSDAAPPVRRERKRVKGCRETGRAVWCVRCTVGGVRWVAWHVACGMRRVACGMRHEA